MESGDALLTFIRHGPHPGMIAQNHLPTLWSTEDLKEPANKPNSPNQLLASSSANTPMARQPATMAHPEGVEGRLTYTDHSPRAPQTTQAVPAGIIQRPVLPGSAPTHQETGQQPTQGQSPSGTAPEIQSTAEPIFTSYGQQPPLVSTTGPASAPMGPNLPPIGHSTSAVQPRQPSSYTFDAAHQRSAVQPFSVPTTQHAQQSSGSVVNSGVQPAMAQPFQMHAAHPPQPTPPNVAPIQSQAPAIHPASMQRHTGQAGPGWPVGGLSQPQLQGIQAQSGPAVSRDGVQPSAVLPGHQWALNPGGSTQMPNQVPTQQGNAMVQSLPQVQAAYGQSGPLNMPAQLSAAQGQTDAAPNPLWPDQSQVTENDLLSLGIPSMFSDSKRILKMDLA